MELVKVSFGIMFGLMVICFFGITGVIKKSPYDRPYSVILPVGFVAAFVCAALGFYILFHHIGQ